MDTRQKIKWGIMGPGLIARRMADALRIHPDCELWAVASKTASIAERFAADHDDVRAMSYQQLVATEELDLIYVATTHNFHFENAKLALEHGKHVVIEKPFTVNAKQASELVRIARENKLFLMEAIWVRFLPSLISLKKQLQQGVIGDPKLIDISYGGFVGPDYVERLTNPDLAGGVTLDMGIYPISFVCYMLGEIPVEIKSMTSFSESGVDELACYQFRFPSGCFASIKVSYNLKMKNESIIYGSRGIIEFPDVFAGECFSISTHDGTNVISNTSQILETNHDNGFIHQVEEAVRCIHEGKIETQIIPLEETVAIMNVVDRMRAEWGFRYPFE
jgi:dihydrodiol dehydrogenase / D-xylose 1-dehydrogenase (NADP)